MTSILCRRFIRSVNIISIQSGYYNPKSPAKFTTYIPKMTDNTPNSDVQPNGTSTPQLRYVDIGINLTDRIYQGAYHGKQSHPSDLHRVLSRAREAGVRKLMVTGSDLEESKAALDMAQEHRGLCFGTVGVHPCQARQFEEYPDGGDALLKKLREVAEDGVKDGSVAAFGEIGLDFDRLHFCDKETQIKWFARQLDLACELHMPLFLHSRAAAEEFEGMLKERLEKLPKRGVVHSFTGTVEEMRRIVELGFDVGINGCSMKTEENLEVVKELPLDRLQIETDGPWCEMRPSQASAKYTKGAPPLPKAVKKEKWSEDCMVKGRNEPCAIVHVAHAIAAVKGVSVEEVCEQ